MSVSNYKRYVVCPDCGNELKADGLLAHYRRAHHTILSASSIAEILSHMTREPTRKPEPPRDLEKHRARLKKEPLAKKTERTPRSMLVWDAISEGIPITDILAIIWVGFCLFN
jgi:hypothetical protein